MSLSVDLYLRLSLDITGEGAGVERQEKECRELVESKGWAVRHVFIDNDVSATTGRARPQFEALLRAKSPAIVVWHIDRLVRVSKDLERVIELGVNVYAVQSGHVDLSNPAGRAVARTVTAWATYEGEQKAVRQKAAAAQRARAGRPWWSSRPFGYERDGTLREDEALSLRLAYAAVLTDTPLTQVAAALNRAGHTTTRGGPWTGTSLRPVLLNARNAAIRVYGGEEIGPADWAPIIPEETYRAAVRYLSNPARHTGGGGRVPRNLLTGIARCGGCGGDVKVGSRGGRLGEPGHYGVYVCRSRSCVSHRQAWMDDYVSAQVIARLSQADAARALTNDDQGDIEGLRTEVVRLRGKLKELRVDYEDDVVTREEFRESTARLRERLREAEGALTSAGLGTPLEGLLGVSDLASAWDALHVERQRGVIETLLLRVELLPRGRGQSAMSKDHVRLEWQGRALHVA